MRTSWRRRVMWLWAIVAVVAAFVFSEVRGATWCAGIHDPDILGGCLTEVPEIKGIVFEFVLFVVLPLGLLILWLGFAAASRLAARLRP